MIKIHIISSLVLLAWICTIVLGKAIPSQLNDDGEVEFVTGSPDAMPAFPGNIPPSGFPGFQGFGPGQGRGNVFGDWMNWIQGFFKDGNWDNGGPSNFGKFIGSQVARLIEMLTRDGGMFTRK